MNVKEYLNNNILYLDGGMGTLLQGRGLAAGELPELWNLTHPEVISEIHRSYLEAGANVVLANTFGANTLKFDKATLENIIKAAIENARRALFAIDQFIALDIGPTGKLLKPFGELDFEDAVEVFAETVRLGEKYGADLIFIETMNDSYETKAALLAAKENSTLPVFVTNAYGEDEKLMTGASPEAMVAMIEGLGADAVGINCSLGPRQMKGIVERLLSAASVPVIVKPNAGLPSCDGEYDITPDEFAKEMAQMIQMGARVVGGCCGTTPDHIKALRERTARLSPVPTEKKSFAVVSSYARAVRFGNEPILIGERINPTGKKRFKLALVEGDMEYILGEGINQAERGVDILDVNVGLPEIDEAAFLERTVSELQAVVDLPLQIDTADPAAMERALRRYNGKAMINSVNGKAESMAAVFPLAKKYGGVIVALTLDEGGIPETAEGRAAIAEKIIKTAESYGIDRKDLVFDTLAMAVSADKNAARITLDAMRIIKERFDVQTSLGVSNISFGLPERDIINSTFFALALENGLSAAIMNPYSDAMMRVYHAYKALSGLDESFEGYIGFASANKMDVPVSKTESIALADAIITGRRAEAAKLTEEKLMGEKPLDIVNGEIIPALDIVGKRFEEKTLYLPQLLMSAEAAKSAFEVIKSKMSASASVKSKIVLATVKGDIHDIGKNIVKLLLQNYGYDVIDLGRDAAPEAIADAVVKDNVPLVGLSALMTTTVPAMEETIKLLRVRAPWCKIVVGGAVLTEEYAMKIGADKYSKDAMETVRYAEVMEANK